jgi:hypothetical protein
MTVLTHHIENALSAPRSIGLAKPKLTCFILLLVTIMIYLWCAPDTIDYPLLDESSYFYRALALMNGDVARSDVLNPRSSPLFVLQYAFWTTLLNSNDVYPYIFMSGLAGIAVAAYLLLTRLFRPGISWFLATMILVAAGPNWPSIASDYIGAAVVCFGLSLLTPSVRLRATGT